MPDALVAPRLALAAALACLAGQARADDKQACIAASEDAQQLSIDGKLIAARGASARVRAPRVPRDRAPGLRAVDGRRRRRAPDGRPRRARRPGARRARGEGVDGRCAGERAPRRTAHARRSRRSRLPLRVDDPGRRERRRAGARARRREEPRDHRDLRRARGAARARRRRPAAAAAEGVPGARRGSSAASPSPRSGPRSPSTSRRRSTTTTSAPRAAGIARPRRWTTSATERWIAGISAGVGALSLGAGAYFFFCATRGARGRHGGPSASTSRRCPTAPWAPVILRRF